MKTILEHRIFYDGNLLLNEFLHDWILVAILGLVSGLAIAFQLWYHADVKKLRLFTIDAKADKVVFIMDVSNSMKNKKKLETCKKSLIESLKVLKTKAFYQVIFFNNRAWFADQGEQIWRKASQENIEKTVESINLVETDSNDDWDRPITMAMELDPPPKIIEFLTDGIKPEGKLLADGIIALRNRVNNETKINTIAFMVPQAAPPLYRIAKKTGGTHTLFLSDGTVLNKEAELRVYLEKEGIQLIF